MAKCQIYLVVSAPLENGKWHRRNWKIRRWKEGENLSRDAPVSSPNLLAITFRDSHEKLLFNIFRIPRWKRTMALPGRRLAEKPLRAGGLVRWWILFWCYASRAKNLLSEEKAQWKMTRCRCWQQKSDFHTTKMREKKLWKINRASFFCHFGSGRFYLWESEGVWRHRRETI